MTWWQTTVMAVTILCFAGSATITGKRAIDMFDEGRYWAGVGWAGATMVLYLLLWVVGLLSALMVWPW